jgi:4'-phosphopantetheinyl transferase
MNDRSLAGRGIHVRPITTVASREVTARFEPVLSPDERTRAAAFRFPHLRDSFILARGALRILLARYLDLAPAAIQFAYGPKGKPALAAPSLLDFNASHSGNLAVFAFTAGCEIGIDIERIRPVPGLQNIADRFFSRREAAELLSLPENHRDQAFFQCWTRKEAYIKATGEGLSAPLDRPQAPDWKLCDLQLTPGYAAALAYRDAERPLTISPLMDPSELLT